MPTMRGSQGLAPRAPYVGRLLGASSIVPAYLVGFTHDNTEKLREAMLNARNGVQSDIVAMMANSTEFPAWSDNVDSDGLEQQSPTAYLKGLLNDQSICPADNDSWMGAGILTTNARVKKHDSCITGATSLIPNQGPAQFGMGGYYLQTATLNAALGYNTSQKGPAVTFDRADVYFTNPTSPNNFDIGTSTGGLIQNVGNDGGLANGAARKITVSVAGSSNGALQVTNRNAGNINVGGMRVWSSTAHKLSIMNLSIPGTHAGDWNTDAGVVPSSYTAGLALLAPKVLLLKDLINAARLGVPINTMKAHWQAIIDAQIARGGQVIMIVDNQRSDDPGDPQPTSIELQQTYRTAMYEIAALNNLPLIDLWIALGTWAYLNSLGLMHDVAHMFAAGNQLVAAAYLEAFKLALTL
jgi:hypothetical protein